MGKINIGAEKKVVRGKAESIQHLASLHRACSSLRAAL